jgi:uncharacterized protein (TIGR00725 family)
MTQAASDRRRTVAVIGDGEVLPGSSKYQLARQVGGLLCERGFRVVTGGLGGIMEAASRGARETSVWTPGTVIALLPGTNPADANPYADLVVPPPAWVIYGTHSPHRPTPSLRSAVVREP